MTEIEIRDWYKEVKDTCIKRGKDFKNHEIEPCSIIGLIGQSGAGKSTALVEFISRAPKFEQILLCTWCKICDEIMTNPAWHFVCDV